MGSDWYSVHMEARASASAQGLTVDEDAADALMDSLEQHDGVVSTGTGTWEATISVEASSAWEATTSGSDLIEKLADKAGMPNSPAVRVDAFRQRMCSRPRACARRCRSWYRAPRRPRSWVYPRSGSGSLLTGTPHFPSRCMSCVRESSG